ncbi:outer membrane beta-barrel family protein [Gelidibacter algens]|nr:outer membrane beta-barrel family protein [Gelidibacter algens]OBX25130.1 hypothetical protein A9996_11535 [Gelidibacter algens]
MKNQFKYLIICLFFTAFINGQTGFSIGGQVLDRDQKPLMGIQIVLIQANEDAIVKIEMTDTEGIYQFTNLKENDYKVLIEDVEFKFYQSESISLSIQNSNRILPPIILMAMDVNNLDEVVITKKKLFVENKIDRTVVNVEAFITAAGGNAMDVLEKSPGITVDQNGTITFKGKSGVQVFIDDKPTYLSGAELETYLRSLPAGTLDKIELMTNPPAKYDATGGAGIINIISKRSNAKGFNASLTSRISQGKRTGNSQDFNFNYMNNKVRLFGNIGYRKQNPFNDLFIFRKFKNDDGTTKSLFYQNSFIDTERESSNAKIGMDYYASDKTTIGLGLNGVLRTIDSRFDVNSEITNPSSVLDSTIVANNTLQEKFKNGAINVNVRHELDSLGQKINVDLDYLKYETTTKQAFNNYVYQTDHSLSSQDKLKGYLPSNIDIYALKTDYILPIKDGSAFETGYKISYTKTDNKAEYRDIIDEEDIPNYNSSNHFKYDEIINAAYVNFNTNYNRFTFQTGLRLENTESKGHQLGNIQKPASKFKNNYTNLFPTVYIKYDLDSINHNSLVMNYGKRINRPFFQMLNPFIRPLDKFTFYLGNPFLEPIFTDTYELSYRYKDIFSTTLNYTFSKNDIAETIKIEEGIYFSQPANIGTSEFFTINMNAQLQFFKWWSASAYNEITHAKFKGQLFTEDFTSSGTFWYVSLNNSLKFEKGWSAEISGTYHTDITNAQFVLLSKSKINLGVQKKLLKDKASIKLALNDIFYSDLNNGIIKNLKNTDAKWRNKLDSRFVALTFSYSFGTSMTLKNQYESDGAKSEKNRVGA